jgi:UrcA family protein
MYRSAMLAAAAALSFVALTTAPAAAQTRETRLTYADLNLSSSAGVEVLNARIRNAARQACGQRFGRVSLREYAQVRACKREFIEGATARVAAA